MKELRVRRTAGSRYHAVERLWLRGYLGSEVVQTHGEIEKGRVNGPGSR